MDLGFPIAAIGNAQKTTPNLLMGTPVVVMRFDTGWAVD